MPRFTSYRLAEFLRWKAHFLQSKAIDIDPFHRETYKRGTLNSLVCLPPGPSYLLGRKVHGLYNSTGHWHCHCRISRQSSSPSSRPRAPTLSDPLTDKLFSLQGRAGLVAFRRYRGVAGVNALGRPFYKGGFEPRMNKREATLILELSYVKRRNPNIPSAVDRRLMLVL